MKIILILIISCFTLFCYGQGKDKLIDNRKQVIIDFLSSEQKVGVKNSFTNYVHFKKKDFKKLEKKYGDSLIQEYFNLVKRDIKDVYKKLMDNKYYIKHESEINNKNNYNLNLNDSESDYDIYYLVNKNDNIKSHFIFEKGDMKIKYVFTDPFPPVFSQKIPVTYLEVFKIFMNENH